MDQEPDDTQTRVPERRRTARLLARVPLRIEPENGTAFEATTAIINRHGALFLSPHPLEIGSTAQVINLEHGISQTFLVVWCGDETEGFRKIGIEMIHPGLDFWGAAYKQKADE